MWAKRRRSSAFKPIITVQDINFFPSPFPPANPLFAYNYKFLYCPFFICIFDENESNAVLKYIII